jgi:hypothetical protein
VLNSVANELTIAGPHKAGLVESQLFSAPLGLRHKRLVPLMDPGSTNCEEKRREHTIEAVQIHMHNQPVRHVGEERRHAMLTMLAKLSRTRGTCSDVTLQSAERDHFKIEFSRWANCESIVSHDHLHSRAGRGCRGLYSPGSTAAPNSDPHSQGFSLDSCCAYCYDNRAIVSASSPYRDHKRVRTAAHNALFSHSELPESATDTLTYLVKALDDVVYNIMWSAGLRQVRGKALPCSESVRHEVEPFDE